MDREEAASDGGSRFLFSEKMCPLFLLMEKLAQKKKKLASMLEEKNKHINQLERTYKIGVTPRIYVWPRDILQQVPSRSVKLNSRGPKIYGFQQDKSFGKPSYSCARVGKFLWVKDAHATSDHSSQV